MQTATIAASYERVSTIVQGRQGFSLTAQHDSMEEYATAQGWLLPEHLRFRDGEDDNASGARWDLPGLTAMLAAGREGAFTVLIVPDLDRFARSLVKGLVLEEQLRAYGVRVVYQRVPVEDTPEGRLLKNQLFSIAEYERERIALRTATGRRTKASTGRVVGNGFAPIGYRYTYETLHNGKQRICGYEPDPKTAPIVQRVFRELQHSSCEQIAKRFNEEGLTTPRGSRWLPRTVRRIASNTAYVGTVVYGSKQYDARLAPEEREGIPVAVPELVDRATWDAAQDALTRRQNRRRGRLPKSEDPYILRGVLTCGHCRGLIRTNVNNGVRYYQCSCNKPYYAATYGKPVCDLPAANAERLEEEFWSVITATLLDREHLECGLEAARAEHDDADQVRQERLAAIDTEMTRQRRRLDALADRLIDAGDGEIYHALLRQAKDIEALLGNLSRERADLAAVRSDGLSEDEALSIRAFAEEIAAGLEHATHADRRRLVELLNVRGTLYADPDGVQLTKLSRFRIDWSANVSLRTSEPRLRNIVLLFRSGADYGFSIAPAAMAAD